MPLVCPLTTPLTSRLVSPMTSLCDAAGGVTKEELLADAKGWYDTTPSTFKTDLVASFDSANSEYFNHPMDSEFDGAFSISVWVKTSGESWQGIIRAGVTSGPSWYLTLSNSGKPHLSVRDSSQSSTHIATSSITLNAWVHIYAGRDSGGATFLEIDGSASGTPVTNVTGTVGLNDGSRHVGRLGSNYFNGEMAHLAVWNRALTSGEITTLYNGGTMQAIPDELKPGGVSYWPLWEPRGVRYDQWGTNHLTDNNTVGAARGPTEHVAGEYAGVTRWLNQGLAASPFGDFAPRSFYDLGNLATLVDGAPYNDGTNYSLEVKEGSLSHPFTVIVQATVENAGSMPSSEYIFDRESGDRAYLQIDTSSRVVMNAGSSIKVVPSPPLDSSLAVYICTFNGANSHLETPGGEVAGDAGNRVPIGFSIFSNYAGNAKLKGTIKGFIVFDRILTDAEKAAINNIF